MDTHFTLGYWGGFRGIAESLRLLAEYTGLKYHEKFYTLEKSTDWFAGDKQTLGLEFPNLPYIIDGADKITESDACIMYIIYKSKRHDLLGKDDKTTIQLITLQGVLNDLRKDLFKLCFDKEAAKTQESVFKEKVYPRLDNFSKYLGSKKFFVEHLSVFDFNFYHMIKIIAGIDPTVFDKHANLKTFVGHFEAIPELQTYLKSERNTPKPQFPPAFATINPVI